MSGKATLNTNITMFLFWLPPAGTRQLTVANLAVGTMLYPLFGIPVGLFLDAVARQDEFGYPIYLFFFSLLGSVGIWPVVLLLAFGCSRIGLIGFGTSLIAGAFLGRIVLLVFEFQLSWSLSLSTSIWLSLTFGLPFSTAFWLIIRHRNPEIFARDRIAQRAWGRVLYACSPLFLLMATYHETVYERVWNIVMKVVHG